MGEGEGKEGFCKEAVTGGLTNTGQAGPPFSSALGDHWGPLREPLSGPGSCGPTL